MQKTITCDSKYRYPPKYDHPSPGNILIEDIVYDFHFSVVDSTIVGEPEEISRTTYSKITAVLPYQVHLNWKLQDASEDEIAKLLFYYAKRYIENKVKTDSLNDYHKVDNIPYEKRNCEIDISRVPNPDGYSFKVEFDGTKKKEEQMESPLSYPTIVYGDIIGGDKIGGDKVGGDKTTGKSAASLVLKIQNPVVPILTPQEDWIKLKLHTSITSDNGISSENGALKLTIANPLMFSNSTMTLFRSADFVISTGLKLEHYENAIPYAQSMRVRWGVNTNSIILPGDWYNFNGTPIVLDIPSTLSYPTYLIRAELFTDNTYPKSMLFSIQQKTGENSFEVSLITSENFGEITASFWETYHLARENE